MCQSEKEQCLFQDFPKTIKNVNTVKDHRTFQFLNMEYYGIPM